MSDKEKVVDPFWQQLHVERGCVDCSYADPLELYTGACCLFIRMPKLDDKGKCINHKPCT